MNVKIYMSEDHKELIYDNDQLSEFKALVSELGLQCDNKKDAEKSPIPYMWLDTATIRAFKLICPKVDKIKEYRFEIPLEILRNVKLCEVEHYFDAVEIWSNVKDPDPFAVGAVYKDDESRTKGYYWNLQYYLIGRWGAEEKSIPELIKIAHQIATRRISDYAKSTIAKMTSWAACPEVWASKYISDDSSEAKSAIDRPNDLPLDF